MNEAKTAAVVGQICKTNFFVPFVQGNRPANPEFEAKDKK
jgi:hypothetical protein